LKFLISDFIHKIVGALAETFGETFLENHQGSDPVESMEDPFQDAGYPEMSKYRGSLSYVPT
jgi:hypothetical protein